MTLQWKMRLILATSIGVFISTIVAIININQPATITIPTITNATFPPPSSLPAVATRVETPPLPNGRPVLVARASVRGLGVHLYGQALGYAGAILPPGTFSSSVAFPLIEPGHWATNGGDTEECGYVMYPLGSPAPPLTAIVGPGEVIVTENVVFSVQGPCDWYWRGNG